MTDAYDHWRRRLAGEDVGMKDGEPMAGYYRAGDVPVAIVPKEEGSEVLLLTWGTAAKPWKTEDRLKVCTAWDRLASAKVVSYEHYLAAYNGEPWPNQSSVVQEVAKLPEPVTLDDYAARIGRLADEGNRLIAAGGAASKDAADQASALTVALQRLESDAEKARKAEKEPHLKASRDVDERWSPLVTTAANVKRDLKAKVLTPWMVAEQDRIKAEQAQAAKVAVETGEPAPAPQAKPKVTTRGGVGLATRKIAEADNLRLTLRHYADQNGPLPEKLVECLNALAKKALDAGVLLPGYKEREVKGAR